MKKSGKEVKEKEGAKQQHFTTTLERKKNHSKTHRWHFLIKLLDFYRVFYIVAEEMQDLF